MQCTENGVNMFMAILKISPTILKIQLCIENNYSSHSEMFKFLRFILFY